MIATYFKLPSWISRQALLPNRQVLVSTYSGQTIDLLNPDPDKIVIDDVAHHTSLINRFTGATRRGYSVAEHGVLVMRLMERDFGVSEVSFAGLMHDAHEYLTGDISSPMKRLCPQVKEVERRIQKVVLKKFNVEWNDEIEDLVKIYDLIARRSEAHALMECKVLVDLPNEIPLVQDVGIVPYLPRAAEIEFMRNYRRYRNADYSSCL